MSLIAVNELGKSANMVFGEAILLMCLLISVSQLALLPCHSGGRGVRQTKVPQAPLPLLRLLRHEVDILFSPFFGGSQ